VSKAIVLIIDDSPANLKILSDLLDEINLDVFVAESGRSALKQLQYITPNLILLDVMMPGMDGFETCLQILANPHTKDIPIIFMTSLSEPEYKIKGLQLGAVDYITKPLMLEEVIARVQLHLRLYVLNKTLSEKNALLHQLTNQLEATVEQRTKQLTETLYSLEQTQQELLKREARLMYEAYHDVLTGLLNRRGLTESIQDILQQPETAKDYALVLIEINHFKAISDSLGLLVGDQLLRSIANRLLLNTLYPFCALARLEGAEFALFLQGVGEVEQVMLLSGQIRQECFCTYYQILHHQVFITVSIGVTNSSQSYENATDMIRDASAALYYAKTSSESKQVLFTPTIQATIAERLYWENELRRAIGSESTFTNSQGEFSLHYQPIVHLATYDLLGFEALIRWHHPQHGLLSPAQFIPIAEESGLIQPLGWWILQQACEELHNWQQLINTGTVRNESVILPILHVNISLKQLTQPNFINLFQQVLSQYNFPLDYLKLEVTESCLLNRASEQQLLLEELQAYGVKLCIDDFGTGYSSLGRLHEFPISTIKIDRSFVNSLDADKNDKIVRAIITLARELDMEVITEGIETHTQLNKLKDFTCEQGQGFLFSQPLDAQSARLMLMHQQPSKLLTPQIL